MEYVVREDYTIKESLSSYEDVLSNTYLAFEDELYYFEVPGVDVSKDFMRVTYIPQYRSLYYIYLETVDNCNVIKTLTEDDLQLFGKNIEEFEEDYVPKFLPTFDKESVDGVCTEMLEKLYLVMLNEYYVKNRKGT